MRSYLILLLLTITVGLLAACPAEPVKKTPAPSDASDVRDRRDAAMRDLDAATQ